MHKFANILFSDYLVSDDFASYLATHKLVDEAFRDHDAWAYKSIMSVSAMGFFTSDRAINEYADTIWNVEPSEVKP